MQGKQGGNVGIFGRAKTASELVVTSVPLRQGTFIALANVNGDFVEWARANYPREPKLGHRVPVLCGWQSGGVVVWHDGKQVAEMDARFVPAYESEFLLLAKQGKVGSTEAAIKWAGSKSPHGLCLNWGAGAYDGGIL